MLLCLSQKRLSPVIELATHSQVNVFKNVHKRSSVKVVLCHFVTQTVYSNFDFMMCVWFFGF